jgi:formylglycine-generating enzyme required for sulfatase activity
MKKSVPLMLVAVLLAFAITACAPPPTPSLEAPTEVKPSAGDTWTRPTDEMVMVYVPAVEFEMGSDRQSDEQPVHTVALDTFWIDQTEVTNGQYRQCVEAEACDAPVSTCSYAHNVCYGDSAVDDYPVLWVTWHQAGAYCEWVGARLPTEAEWEYAGRGPEGRVYPWGNTFDDTKLNYEAIDTTPVGSLPGGASWCGAQDLAGNAAEWVSDWYGKYPSERQENPEGPSEGVGRVIRGGGYFSTQPAVRSAARGAFSPNDALQFAGFRCAREAE